MKTATVRDLRNHYRQLLEWLQAGEDIAITRRGKTIAHLIPTKEGSKGAVDWTKSAAFRRDRSLETVISAKDSAEILNDVRGKW